MTDGRVCADTRKDNRPNKTFPLIQCKGEGCRDDARSFFAVKSPHAARGKLERILALSHEKEEAN